MTPSVDTIAAIATAPGRSAIAIVRVSGPDSLSIADRVFHCHGDRPSRRPANTFAHGFVAEPGPEGKPGPTVIDEAILLIYRAPHSYTREDAIELQSHGGPLSVRRILGAVLDAGARPAEPGEFTKRAFLNGRLDLLQAEAVMDLISAQSDRASRTAVMQLEGDVSVLLADIYAAVISTAADIEASLDFPDCEFDVSDYRPIEQRLAQATGDMQKLLLTWREGRVLRDGIRVAIIGRPNVGKSTLLNKLIGADRAIVSEHPGTTRDTIEETVTLDGFPLHFVDTAGLRQTDCHVERIGVERSIMARDRADLVIYVIDAAEKLHQSDRDNMGSLDPDRTLVVLNKRDLGMSVSPSDLLPFRAIPCSLLDGGGFDSIRHQIVELAVGRDTPPSAFAISERHRQLIATACHHAETAQSLLRSDPVSNGVLAAGHLRVGIESLDRLTGRNYSDELLESIFSRFCVGK